MLAFVNTFLYEFIPAGNEPSSHACMDVRRLPRGVPSACDTRLAQTEAERSSNTPLPCSATNLMPRCLQRGLLPDGYAIPRKCTAFSSWVLNSYHNFNIIHRIRKG